ncbi:hypothetical protein GCM10027359_22040 [Marilutibacter aestuarii]
MQVAVDMHTEDLLTGEHRLATRGGFTMIAMDPEGRPTAIRPLPDPTGHDWTAAQGMAPRLCPHALQRIRDSDHTGGSGGPRELPAKPVTR